MLPTHPVPCPRCRKTLYWAVSLDDGVDAGAVESPRVEQDAGGFYRRGVAAGFEVRNEEP